MSEVQRRIGTRGDHRVSVISQVYATDQDDLWDAVTDPERIARWFLPVEGDLKEGGRYQLTGNAGGTVTSCDRPNSFAATWEMGDMVTWIEVRLRAVDDGHTEFELEHYGPVPDEFWDQFGAGATGLGWDMGLTGLYWHVTDPAAPRDEAKIQAWLTSDDGKRTLRESADGWAAAEITAGAAPEVARRHADTSYAAYTATPE